MTTRPFLPYDEAVEAASKFFPTRESWEGWVRKFLDEIGYPQTPKHTACSCGALAFRPSENSIIEHHRNTGEIVRHSRRGCLVVPSSGSAEHTASPVTVEWLTNCIAQLKEQVGILTTLLREGYPLGPSALVLVERAEAILKAYDGPAAESPSVSPTTKSESRKTPAPGDAGGPLGTNCANGGCPSCHFLQCTCGCHRDAEADPIRYPDFNVLTPSGSDAAADATRNPTDPPGPEFDAAGTRYRWCREHRAYHPDGGECAGMAAADVVAERAVLSVTDEGESILTRDFYVDGERGDWVYRWVDERYVLVPGDELAKLRAATSADDARVQALVSIGAQALWIEKNEPGSPSAGWASSMLDLIRAVLPAFDSYTKGNGVAPLSADSNEREQT